MMEFVATVKFPCSPEEWEKLNQLNNMFPYKGTIAQTVALAVETPVVTESSASESTDESTPLLDALDESLPDMKYNYHGSIKDRIIEMAAKHPGLTRSQLSRLVRQTYPDLNTGTVNGTIYVLVKNSEINVSPKQPRISRQLSLKKIQETI